MRGPTNPDQEWIDADQRRAALNAQAARLSVCVGLGTAILGGVGLLAWINGAFDQPGSLLPARAALVVLGWLGFRRHAAQESRRLRAAGTALIKAQLEARPTPNEVAL